MIGCFAAAQMGFRLPVEQRAKIDGRGQIYVRFMYR